MDDATANVLREMTPAQHLAIADRMWKYARDLLNDNVVREHPDWTNAAVQREIARRISDPVFEEWAYKNIPVSLFL